MDYSTLDPGSLDFSKGGGLIPVIVQDAASGKVLMQAYMNADALSETLASGKVTFFSRSRNRLWTKGETSGNFLHVKNIQADCDRDSLLVTASPDGPVCHTGLHSCFDVQIPLPEQVNQSWPDAGENPAAGSAGSHTTPAFLEYLENLLRGRMNADPEKSYTARLLAAGPKRIAKKLGEEAVELVMEAEAGEPGRFIEEAADLVYHLSVLLVSKGLGWNDIVAELEKRHKG
jgi:phosphoribosyl-AMP cyclohydrolase / phosphoribosyl-ATP pyrophosphohydrolase